MNTFLDIFANWLLSSTMVLLILMGLLFITRAVLLSFNYSRVVVLKLWLAIPLGLVCCLIAMNLVSQKVLLTPIVFSYSAPIGEVIKTVETFNPKSLLVLVWLLVALLKVGSFLRLYWNVKHRVLTSAKQMKSNHFYTELNTSPMAIGLFKPIIVIPKYLVNELSPQELSMVVLHEQIHCARSDPFWRFALELLCCLYWFLPLKTKIKETLVTDQEMSCDEKVIEESKQLGIYARLLLKLNLSLHTRKEYNSDLFCSSSLKLKERIMKLNQSYNNKNQRTIISIFLFLVFTVSSMTALAKISDGEDKAVELTPINKVVPNYPRSAAVEKITGEVKLSFVVTTQGLVKDVKVIESNPGDVFVKEAVRAMKKWTFEPIAKETQAQQVLRFAMD
jgi:TonB family protein